MELEEFQMTSETLDHLVISGSGKAAGGTYQEVKINGSGKITSDLQCVEFKTNGSSEVLGNVSATKMKINGSSVIKGNVVAEEIKTSGSAKVLGNVSSKILKVSGSMEIQGDFTGEQVEIKGSVVIQADCEAESFIGTGGFTIGGLLNAGTIDILVHGHCEAREIGGERITVKKGGMAFGLRRLLESIFPFETHLTTDTIEGDEIYLEYTKAKVVRGTHVTIGPGCEIDRVEYNQEFHQDKGAKVKESKKL
jgi:cytoskeletal protein CcmA (bactofilin family)